MYFEKEKSKHRLLLRRPALLLIDFQNYFCRKDGKAYLAGVERMLPVAQRLLKIFVNKELPVVVTIHRRNSRSMMRWWNNSIEDDQAEPCLDCTGAILLYKDSYDAFYMTNLEEILREKKVEQIVLGGVMTHLCVETTARSAFVRGFDVVVVEDVCWDKEDWYHFASLKNLAHGFAVITNSDELICALESLEPVRQV
ncbi:cysteine hydrolase [Thermotoga sp. Ku-13t]|uniref:cysteine hydrolase n=1 Tax=Thermotoga sp. Ku-13t TaxID=1755813 RepID=UPI0013E9DCDB|nr:isochorismatase family protein [Thermotoga sp. Ku-13t]KAF2958010.1 cysteine hydrolase [Thermotoga sp. Ku-13t]